MMDALRQDNMGAPKRELGEGALEKVTGAGDIGMGRGTGLFMEVRVEKGYLALRTAPEYRESNEIGRLYTGDIVKYLRPHNKDYIYVYSQKHGQSGYVNCGFVVNPYTGKTGDPVPIMAG